MAGSSALVVLAARRRPELDVKRSDAVLRWLAIGTALFAAAVLAVVALDAAFRREFERRAAAAVAAAGRQDGALLREEDLRGAPEPLARWVRWSGALGRPRPSVLRLSHGGRFKAGASRPWLPIHGEYVITTRRPSFHWMGKMKLAPGVYVAAVDSYLAGHGRMQVKALSAFTLVDARGPELDDSGFGRCLVELAMVPTFYLDRELVRCAQAGPDHVRCRVDDGMRSGDADVFVNADGSLDRVEVLRRFERDGGRSTREVFVGKASGARSFGGWRLPSRLDGSWKLPEGDLHYVAFDVLGAVFE